MVLPAGRHVVKLLYKDRAFGYGKIVSALTLTGCLVVSVPHRKIAKATPDREAEGTSEPALHNPNLN